LFPISRSRVCHWQDQRASFAALIPLGINIVNYRCGGYTAQEHPRDRVPKPDLDRQVLVLFERIKVEDRDVREWFRPVLASQNRDALRRCLSTLLSLPGNRPGAHQTAYMRLPHADALQEKFYWRTVTPISRKKFHGCANMTIGIAGSPATRSRAFRAE